MVFLPRLPMVPGAGSVKQDLLYQWAGDWPAVTSQPAIVADADRHGNAGAPQLDAAHLPALDQPVAAERQHIDDVEREVVADIETAVASFPGSVVGIRPRGSAVVSA